MDARLPKNGPLSGMVITAVAAFVVMPLAFAYEPVREHFEKPLSPSLRAMFLVTVVLMALHKAESYWFHEYDECPVYLTSGRAVADNPRRAIFVGFVPTFVGMTFVLYLAFLGPPWHLLLFVVWLAQGLHEVHHLAKTLARKKLYPGVFTAIAFVLTMTFGVFPLWHDEVVGARGALFYAYYAAVPVLLAAYYLEDRRWTSRAAVALPTASR
jgi:hypothetical protein